MLSDIEIAQQATMKKIGEIASALSIEEDDIEYYGHYTVSYTHLTLPTTERV